MDIIKASTGESLSMQHQHQQTQQQQQQQQLQQQQQQQKLKKKSKNKKKSSRTEAATTLTPGTTTASMTGKDVVLHNDSCDVQDVSELVNGLSVQIKQQLHLGVVSKEVNTINDTKFKVNGLVTEKYANTNACPNKTNSKTANFKSCSDAKPLSIPALNGYHTEEHSISNDINEVNATPLKKTKRKPNNKKNPPSTTITTAVTLAALAAAKANGHCPSQQYNSANAEAERAEDKERLHNGYQHEDKMDASILEKCETTSQFYDTKTAMTPAKCEETELICLETENKNECSSENLKGVESPAIENPLDLSNVHIEYKQYESELQMHDIMRLIQAELSEPYSIYTYRYFIYNWPNLCFLAADGDEYVGAIVCKLGMHMNVRRGYIAMLAVRKEYRKLKIGTTLVQKAIEAMLADKADEVVLETEMSNLPALRLYENLGFVRDKRLFRYYLNGVDALRLKLWFR